MHTVHMAVPETVYDLRVTAVGNAWFSAVSISHPVLLHLPLNFIPCGRHHVRPKSGKDLLVHSFIVAQGIRGNEHVCNTPSNNLKFNAIPRLEYPSRIFPPGN